MPQRPAPDHDDEELLRYLLGRLPDEARERLDEASIADDEFVACLRTAETNLIDSYVRGRLSGDTLERFESYYLSSPLRRANVRAAARFLGAVDRSAARSESAPFMHRLARPIRFVPIAAVATLALVVGGVFVFRAARPRSDVTLATSANPAVERPADVPRQADPVSASPSPPSLPVPGSDRPASPGPIVAIVLLPPTRSVAPIPTLTVATGVDRVRFELQLESNDFPRYRVGLKDPATNQIVWRSSWIAPGSAADPASVSVLVPAALLGPQRYSLDLTGRDAGDRDDVIGSYPVRIARP
jgi:hypothetical protein